VASLAPLLIRRAEAATKDSAAVELGDPNEPFRACLLRATQRRLVVQVVTGHAHRLAGVRRDHVHEEPQAPLEHEVADEFFVAVVRQAKLRRYISSEHFSVDGT
jgi:hypothetical protein